MSRPISKNPRRQFVGVKLTDDQLEILMQASHIMGMPLSTMIRSMAVSQALQLLGKSYRKKTLHAGG